MIKSLVAFFDRDDTLIVTNDSYPGTDPEWKEKPIEFVGGSAIFRPLKTLQSAGAYLFTASNQSGVALRGIDLGREINFDNLTEEVMWEVDKRVRGDFGHAGVIFLDGFCCPYVDGQYAQKAKDRGRDVDPRYVQDNPSDMKPNIGMLRRAEKYVGSLEVCDLWMIGDRFTDVLTGLNAGGRSVLVRGPKTVSERDLEKVEGLPKELRDRVYVSQNGISDAVRYVVENRAS